jgi:putative aldouronate transport system substrate-binding protein
MRNNRIKVAILSTILALGTLLTACGNPSNEKPSEDGKGNVTEISIMTNFFSDTPPADDNPVKLVLEKATNTHMKIQWVSPNNYLDKLNVTLASGDLPDMVYIIDPFSPVFRQMVVQGAFWEITPYLKDYPNFNNVVASNAWQVTKMSDGKNYGVPRPRPIEGETWLSIRSDWLDQLGLKMPSTTEELYQVMKAFAQNDPDKNGKQDTYGYAGYVNASDMGNLGVLESIYTGASSRLWKQQDGKMVFVPFLPETRQALGFLSNAYKDKLIPADFASMKDSQAKEIFRGGKAGILNEKGGAATYLTDIIKIQPSAKTAVPVTINGYNPKGTGFAGLYAISKKVPEAKMKKILQFINDGMNQDVFDLIKYGVKDIHYTEKDGIKVIDQDKYKSDKVSEFQQILFLPDPYTNSVSNATPKDMVEMLKKTQDERAKTSVPDYSAGLYSPTGGTILPEFNKKMQDLKTKIILGLEPITAWDEFVEKMKKDSDVNKTIQEINDAYKKRISEK